MKKKVMHHSDVQISAERCFIPILSEPLIYPLTRVLILFFFSHAFLFSIFWLFLLCINLLKWGFLHYYDVHYHCKKERNQVMLIFLCRRSKTMMRTAQHFCFWGYILVSDGSFPLPLLLYFFMTLFECFCLLSMFYQVELCLELLFFFLLFFLIIQL